MKNKAHKLRAKKVEKGKNLKIIVEKLYIIYKKSKKQLTNGDYLCKIK